MRWSHSIFLGICTAIGFLSIALAQDVRDLTLQEALAQNLVQIESIHGTSSDGLDYGQPLAVVTLASRSDSSLQITLPLGSQLQPVTEGPSLVVLGFAQSPVTIAPKAKLEVGIISFSTQVALHPTKENNYTLSEITNKQNLLELLALIKQDGRFIGPNLVPQRAVWQIANDTSCQATDQAIQSVFGIALGCQSTEAESVAALIAPTQTPTQIPVTPIVSPTPSLNNTKNSATSTLLAIFGAVIFFVGLGIAGFFLQKLRMSTKAPLKPASTKPSSNISINNRPDREGNKANNTSPPEIFEQRSAPFNPQRRSSPTQPLQALPQFTSLPSTPSIQNQPDGEESTSLSLPNQALPDQSSTANSRTGRRAAVTSMLTAPSIPDALCKPAISLTMITNEAGTPVNIFPFTLLTRSCVQQSEITSPDGTISSPHCMIRYEQQHSSWTVSDLASLNGTFVNGTQVPHRSTLLVNGATLQIGSLTFQFQSDAQGDKAILRQIEPATQPIAEYHFDPNDHPYWLLTARRLLTVEINNSAVSVPHALISFEDGWFIRDLNSTGGVAFTRSLNSSKHMIGKQPQRIVSGDRLVISNQINCQLQTPELPHIGSYQPVAWLGQGKSTSIFLSHRNNDTAQVALKLLISTSATDSAMFKREAALLSELQGQNIQHIVPFREAVLDSLPNPYIVFEYIQGATLRTLLRINPDFSFSQEKIIAIAFAIGAALSGLHQLGWVHCDVKPENIFINRSGVIFLGDFGSITRLNERPLSATAAYAPPEFRSQPCEPASAAADIYSLGVVLYEMLTGLPYHHSQATEPHRRLSRQTSTMRLIPSDQESALLSSSALGVVIDSCLKPLPNRFQQIDDLLKALASISQGLPNSDADFSSLVQQIDGTL